MNSYWSDSTYIAKDEIVKCRIVIKNSIDVQNVTVHCVLTDNLELVDDVKLITERHPSGYTVELNAIEIGDLKFGDYAEIDFSLRAVNPEEAGAECATTDVNIDGIHHQQSAEISVENSNGGWGDNTNGRRDYTLDEVNQGILGDIITFNSISDGKIGHEFNFVGARLEGETGLWNANVREVKDGEVYVIRLFVHNNSHLGYDAIAEDVKVTFSLPDQFAKEHTIIGYLDSSNAVPSRYWDGVTLKSDQYFYLEYIEGSALWENNIGERSLSDDVIISGALVGYEELVGEIFYSPIYAAQLENYIVQPFIDGREYTIDIFCDWDVRPVSIVPRERLKVRAGEVLKTKIEMDKIMIRESKVLCENFRPCGPMTVQLIRDREGIDRFIEINPRFGGGVPLSMKAGARYILR